MALTEIFTFNFTNAVEQTRQIPVTAVPVGITVLQAAIARGSLDPAIVLAWSLDVSRDGGTSWLPWGAAGTVGGPAFNKDGSLATESTFTLFLETPADAQTRLRGSLTNTGARMTTTITIRGDTTPIQPRGAAPEHQSVVYDNFVEVRGTNVITLTTSSFTITTGPNRVAVLGWFGGQEPTAITSSCGGTSGALVTGTTSSIAPNLMSLIHAVTAPPSGSRTATMSWTNMSFISVGVMTASGVNQVTPTSNATAATGTSVTPAVTVATAVGDLTFAIGMPQNQLSAPTQTNLWLDTTVTGGGGSRGPGTGISDVHSWTQTSGAWCTSGCNLVADRPVDVYDFTLFPKPILQPVAAFPENR